MSFVCFTCCAIVFFICSVEALTNPATILAQINTSGASIAVPASFLGFSHEPLTMADPIATTAEYQGLVRLLSSFNTGPFIIRWGGNGQDLQNTSLTDGQWKAMANLHNVTGVRYMIGLNLKVRARTHTADQDSEFRQSSWGIPISQPHAGMRTPCETGSQTS